MIDKKSCTALKKVAVILAAAAVFSSCKTCVPIVETRDSLRIEQRLDSIFIYQHDSIFRDRWRNGDTVFVQVEKWQTRYKDKIVQVHDTIKSIEVQTQQVKIVPSYYKTCTILFWIICILAAVITGVKILIKIYLK